MNNTRQFFKQIYIPRIYSHCCEGKVSYDVFLNKKYVISKQKNNSIKN